MGISRVTGRSRDGGMLAGGKQMPGILPGIKSLEMGKEELLFRRGEKCPVKGWWLFRAPGGRTGGEMGGGRSGTVIISA